MSCIKKLFSILFFISYVHLSALADNEPVITFKFEKVPLKDVIDILIYKHNIPVIYLKNQVDSILVTGMCTSCTQEEAVKKVLLNSGLAYKKINNQFVIYNPKLVSESQINKEINIQGIIIDSLTQEPLPYASIVVEGMNKGTASNRQGTFRIENLPPDIYKLKIGYVGYDTDSIIADLRQPQNSRFYNIKLASRNLELTEVEVNTNVLARISTVSATTTSTIAPELLKTVPTSDPGDIAQNIKLIPGVSGMPNNLGGFNMRGGSADQTLVQFDNIPIYHSGHLWGFNSSFNSDAVESINILSGGFSASYSDFLSGIVDIKGKSGKFDRFHGGVFANLFTAKAFISTPITKRIGLFLSINSNTNLTNSNSKILNRADFVFFNQYQNVELGEIDEEPVIFTSGNTIPYEQKYYSNYHDVYGRITAAISPKDSLFVSFISNYDQIKIKSKIETQIDLIVDGERTEKWQTSAIAINNTHYWTKNTKSEFGVVYSDYRNTANFYYVPVKELYYYNRINRNTNYIQQGQIYSNTFLQLSDYSKLVLGFKLNSIKTGFERNTFDGILDTLKVTGDTLNAFLNKASSFEYNGYTEYEQVLLENLKLTLGARFTYNQIIKLMLAEPRINIHYKIWKDISVQASWGMFHQNFHSTPSAISYNVSSFSPSNVWILSQKGLSPSQSQHWLTGLCYDSKKWAVHLSAFYKTYSNLTFIIPSRLEISDYIYEGHTNATKYASWLKNRKVLQNNINNSDSTNSNYDIDYFTGGGYSKGIELFMTKKLGIYTGFVSYCLSSTRYKFPYISLGKEFTADYDRTHELKILNSLQYHGWNLSCLYTVASGKPYPLLLKPQFVFYSDSRISTGHPLWWKLDNTQRTPAYQSVDVSLSKKITKFRYFDLIAGVTVQNVFDHKNVIGRYYTIIVDEYTNSKSMPDENPYDQKGTGRLFNVFLNIEF